MQASVRKIPVLQPAEPRLVTEYYGPLNGSYTLSERHAAVGERPEVFACQTQSISTSAATLTAPAVGGIGEWLTARLEGIGIIRGSIIKHIADGFVFGIVATAARQTHLAKTIDLLRSRAARAPTEQRNYKRFKPIDPRSVLVTPDGHVQRCFVIDMSRSGAAISADFHPEIGSSILIGKLACHVVRQLEIGFAVHFDAPQEAEGLEDLLTGFEPMPPKLAPAVWDSVSA